MIGMIKIDSPVGFDDTNSVEETFSKEIAPLEELSVPDGVVSLLTDAVKDTVLNLPEEIASKTEAQLLATHKYGTKDHQIRRAFWEEYDRCLREGEGAHMDMSRIYKDIMTRQTFYQRFLVNPHRVAYMLKEPERLAPKFKNIIAMGVQKMEDLIANAKLTYPNGMMDAKAAKVLLDMVEFLYTRTYGAVIQKHQIDQRSLNVNVTKDAVPIANMEQRLAEIKTRLIEAEGKTVVSTASEFEGS